MRPYAEDLAYIHDVGHGDFARQAAPFVLELLRSRGLTAGRVIDLGCGSGIWAEQLVGAGYRVLGVDLSPAMIALARKRAPKAEFRVGSFLDADLPDCVAVTALGEIFNYLFDSANDTKALAGLFRRIHRVLAPGGVFLFDVLQPGHVQGSRPQRKWRAGADWAVLVEIDEDPEQARLTRRITSFRKAGKLYRRSDEVHRQQLLPSGELAAELRRVGFRVTRLRGYGPLRFAGSQVALLAHKP